jgi:hypothetical protein
MISSYQEALILYSTCEAERRELEFALQHAQAELQRAMQKFQYVRKGLTKTEFRAGKIRRMIKKSGFPNVLASKIQHRPIAKIHGYGMFYVLLLVI